MLDSIRISYSRFPNKNINCQDYLLNPNNINISINHSSFDNHGPNM